MLQLILSVQNRHDGDVYFSAEMWKDIFSGKDINRDVSIIHCINTLCEWRYKDADLQEEYICRIFAGVAMRLDGVETDMGAQDGVESFVLHVAQKIREIEENGANPDPVSFMDIKIFLSRIFAN